MLTIQIYESPTQSRLLADLSGRIADAQFSTNGHGFAALNVPLVPMSLTEAFEWYTWPGMPHVVVSDAGVVWEGRLEDIAIVNGGVSLMALGYSRALYDVLYTALWSRASTADWQAVTGSDWAGATPERYEIDNNNRLFIAPKKGETFSNGTHNGAMSMAVPHGSSRDVAAFEANYDMLLPAGWLFRVVTMDDAFGGYTLANSVTATGSAQSGTLSLSLTPGRRVLIQVRNDTGGASTITAETGVNYLRLTGVRVKSTGAAAVLATDIAAALAEYVRGFNLLQISGDASLIDLTADDLHDEVYEDARPSAILDRLALLHGAEWGVWEGRRLRFATRGGTGRHWYVDVTETPELQRSVENLFNGVYATYRDAGGRTRRTVTTGDGDSQARYGVRRVGVLNVQTTSLAEAQIQQARWLADRATLTARARLDVRRVYGADGGAWPVWLVRAGDTVTMRNLPPTLAVGIDRIRTFRIAETEYDAAAGVMQMTPEEPTPTLVTVLARREAGL
jgi:hypothetical protein